MSDPNEIQTVLISSQPIEMKRLLECNRQEKETFDQRKSQDNLWFILKLAMGFSSILLLIGVFLIAGYVLLHSEKYIAAVVASAREALFANIIGLMACVWKIVFNPKSVIKLEPITRIEVKSKNRAMGISLCPNVP